MSKIPVMLSICGKQCYEGQEPDCIELVTQGLMFHRKDVWLITYAESELTGLEGVNTHFRVDGKGVILRRTGRLQSEMIFREGERCESLYQMEFGTIMISVCARRIAADLSEETGGTVDLVYNIEVENTIAGTVEYHLDVKPIQENGSESN